MKYRKKSFIIWEGNAGAWRYRIMLSPEDEIIIEDVTPCLRVAHIVKHPITIIVACEAALRAWAVEKMAKEPPMKPASVKQINFIHALCRDLEISEADAICQAIDADKEREELTAEEASNVIEWLLMTKDDCE